MRIQIGILVMLVCGPACLADEKFVVHEWGVMVRDHLESPGKLAAPDELISTLPAFALRHDKSYTPKRTNFGWDKPIIYFYGKDGLAVDVRLDTAEGEPLAYFPRPDSFIERQGKQITSRREMMIYSISEAVGMKWSGTLSAEPKLQSLGVPDGHWWAAARKVPASWFTTKNGGERFLFYEATARQEPTVMGMVAKDKVVFKNVSKSKSGPVLLIVNDGKSRFLGRVDSIDGGAEMTLGKETVTAREATDKDVLEACGAACREFGLTGPEADALVAAWKSDVTTRLGFMVISRLGTAEYDKIFPLTITPKPDEVVRVGLVFDTLPGQDARLSWLPGFGEKLAAIGKELGGDDFPTRDAAQKKLASYGDLAKPFLENLVDDKDPEVGRAAGILLEGLKPKATTQPAAPAVNPVIIKG